MTGQVKWWDDKKGHGFIAVDGDDRNAFVHHTEVEGQRGRKTLVQGQRVTFDGQETDKGLRAVKLMAIADVGRVPSHGDANLQPATCTLQPDTSPLRPERRHRRSERGALLRNRSAGL